MRQAEGVVEAVIFKNDKTRPLISIFMKTVQKSQLTKRSYYFDCHRQLHKKEHRIRRYD